MVVSLWIDSRLSPPLIRIPFSAPLPVPTIMAVGVARPRAQGQAMIMTATKLSKAKVRAGGGPQKNQTIKVSTAIPMTIGTKIPAT